ncbi:MAG: GAF domain-containing protein [Luteolibacter sp.]
MQEPTGNADGDVVNSIHRIGFTNLLDSGMAADLSAAFLAANADEGTVWLLSPTGDSLVAQYNTGADAVKIMGFQQPLGRGLISMVFETEQAFCENDVQRNCVQDKRLDRRVGKSTMALIAVPFSVRGEICGVISCVQLEGGISRRTGFTGMDLDRVMQAELALHQAVERSLATSPP